MLLHDPIGAGSEVKELVPTAVAGHRLPRLAAARVDEHELAGLLAAGLRGERLPSRSALARALDRLTFLRRPTAWLGGRAAGIAKALGSLRRAIGSSGRSVLALAAVLALDLLHDGDIELLALLAGMLD